jgi:predicted DNA-binding transcriptional regulator AlpA
MEQNMGLLDKAEVQETLSFHREIIYKKLNAYHNGFCLRILENI